MAATDLAETHTLLLDERGLLEARGVDARPFLDGIVTNDLDRLARPGDAIAAGLLTPQGKILFEMLIIQREADAFLIDVAASERATLLKRLQFYRLRAKVELADLTGTLALVLLLDGAAAPFSPIVAYDDPRSARLGRRVVVGRDFAGLAALPAVGSGLDYAERRITAGVAEIPADYPSGDVFPHDVNMDLIGAVDFAKGCYVGQEVVSRTQHKALPRKRIARITAPAGGLVTGNPVNIGEADIGRIGTVSGDGRRALALLRLDRVVEAIEAGAAIESGGAALTVDPDLVARYRAAAAARKPTP